MILKLVAILSLVILCGCSGAKSTTKYKRTKTRTIEYERRYDLEMQIDTLKINDQI